MSASEILANSFSADAALRHDAESKLEALARDDLPTFLATLMPELVNESNPLPIRNAAALNMKNAIVARVLVAYLMVWFLGVFPSCVSRGA
ncbi:unnamed protein product [Rhizoctonia solani]|uniref:Importin N-terminal domain-containing protein n=1 Tax=Rhizoctonia solani TaxID=456999 RepID=A0A8H3D0I6_9AGAM|nr:unnamed protein product [Rhizoctonia solani]